MAEVENVAGTTAHPRQDFLGPRVDKLVPAQQNRRIEVTLNCNVAKNSPRFV